MRLLPSSDVGWSLTDGRRPCGAFSQSFPAGNQEITMVDGRILVALALLLALAALVLAGCGGGGGGY
jgi:hypothetical protein